jgi:hypothetical protein
MTGSRRVDNLLEKSHDTDRHPLRHRTRHFWLLAFYVPLIIVPWALTCVLAKRPINAPSYVNQMGFLNYTVMTFRNLRVAVDVLNTIAALVTIPFLSALLAPAAVVFAQRRTSGEIMSLHDVFVLADRGW